MSYYLPILAKFSLGLICLILQITIMGKGNLAPTSPMDQVQNFVLGGIIGGVIYNEAITVLQFVLVLIIWTLLVLILKFAKEHNRWIKRIIDGSPVTLIRNGVVNVQDCLRIGISANDLMFKLRSNGIFEVEKVKLAVMEQNGQLNVIEYGAEMIRYPIIVDGQANFDLLEIIEKDSDWLEAEVKKQGYERIGEIYLGEYLNGNVLLTAYDV
ncbi:DUF421 domain-containing protein [Enterococcus saigonensis]|uniref:DUF421 domain-containing protein n=1 Tax=Enterococcus saigonensis TaxID=1805431 RepID=A0A679I9Z8_9ENTE|nr:DUF421 domain-containing protein [Enterococcus saigonensis]BCA84859.1 DUF421 domain-containing protein [Enterococcus saigonensis]